MLNDIGYRHTILGQFRRRQVPRQSVEINPADRCPHRRAPFCQQSRNHPGQGVAAAAPGEAGVAVVIEVGGPIWRGHKGRTVL